MLEKTVITDDQIFQAIEFFTGDLGLNSDNELSLCNKLRALLATQGTIANDAILGEDEKKSGYVCGDCGTPLRQGYTCDKCNGFSAVEPEEWAASQPSKNAPAVLGAGERAELEMYRQASASLLVAKSVPCEQGAKKFYRDSDDSGVC